MLHSYCCKIKKYGRLLYRPPTDLTVNLARAFAGVLEPITQNGWTLKEGHLAIHWDTEDNAIKERGCKCLSGCHIKRCRCVKKNQLCSAGCECTHCTNISSISTCPTPPITTELPLNDWDDLDDDLDDIMISVFSEEDQYEPNLHQESGNDDGECSDD